MDFKKYFLLSIILLCVPGFVLALMRPDFPDSSALQPMPYDVIADVPGNADRYYRNTVESLNNQQIQSTVTSSQPTNGNSVTSARRDYVWWAIIFVGVGALGALGWFWHRGKRDSI